jgi:Rad52/22 family double-strand break repair protein
MPFAETQIRQLAGKLQERHVKTREQFGMTLSYVEGWHLIAEANRIFGFDGWDRETVSAERIWEDGRRDPKACAYAARVRIRVRAGDTVVFRDGSGVGQGTGATLGEAHESALKEAETDAMKRALMTFGNPFGLALYDREQRGVRHAKKGQGAGAVLTPFILYGPAGESIGTHPTPQAFCQAMKEAICTATAASDLGALWRRNGSNVERLRVLHPRLKTARGTHYADVLQRHYERQLGRLSASEPQSNAEPGPLMPERRPGDGGFLVANPRRVRDPEHLKHVASQPCLICARTPAQAHHLRFMQPRAMSSKVSDEWTVPLCVTHHRALHDVGNEVQWWEQWKIDAKVEAEKLWKETHGSEVIAEAVESSPSVAVSIADALDLGAASS